MLGVETDVADWLSSFDFDVADWLSSFDSEVGQATAWYIVYVRNVRSGITCTCRKLAFMGV